MPTPQTGRNLYRFNFSYSTIPPTIRNFNKLSYIFQRDRSKFWYYIRVINKTSLHLTVINTTNPLSLQKMDILKAQSEIFTSKKQKGPDPTCFEIGSTFFMVNEVDFTKNCYECQRSTNIPLMDNSDK